jgi:hypothetical protein
MEDPKNETCLTDGAEELLKEITQVSKRKIPYEQLIKNLNWKLSTGKSGFANGHKNRVTFKNYIELNPIQYNNKSVNQDADNLLIKAAELFELPDFIIKRAKYLLAKTWNKGGQKQNYNKMTYEIAALGILKYCCKDLNHIPDIDSYVDLIYLHHIEIIKKHKQFDRAYKQITELCKVDKQPAIKDEKEERNCLLTHDEKMYLMKNYRTSHGTLLNKFHKVEIIYNQHQKTLFDKNKEFVLIISLKN